MREVGQCSKHVFRVTKVPYVDGRNAMQAGGQVYRDEIRCRNCGILGTFTFEQDDEHEHAWQVVTSHVVHDYVPPPEGQHAKSVIVLWACECGEFKETDQRRVTESG